MLSKEKRSCRETTMSKEKKNVVESKTIKLKSCQELSRKRTIFVKRDNVTKSFQEIDGIVDRGKKCCRVSKKIPWVPFSEANNHTIGQQKNDYLILDRLRVRLFVPLVFWYRIYVRWTFNVRHRRLKGILHADMSPPHPIGLVGYKAGLLRSNT